MWTHQTYPYGSLQIEAFQLGKERLPAWLVKELGKIDSAATYENGV